MRISVVIPCFNESQNIAELHRRLVVVAAGIDGGVEFVFVDDGSSDDTLLKLKALARQDERVRVVVLSRNFGHQAALSAGIEHAVGAAVVVLDADLQHPPELIHKFIQKWEDGFDLVYAYREGIRPRIGYRLINAVMKVQVPVESADFRLMDRRVVEAFRQMPERARFIRGMISWLGFRQIGIGYQDDDRFAGRRSYTVRQTAGMAITAFLSFSSIPLRITSILGLLTLGLGLVYAIYILVAFLSGKQIEPGWTGLMMTMLILGGVQLLCLGVMAEYIGRIFEEVKRRPLYVVRELVGHHAQDEAQRPGKSGADTPTSTSPPA